MTTPEADAPHQPRLGSDLCLQCGMCCDGTVANTVSVEPDELDTARRVGIALEASSSTPGGPPNRWHIQVSDGHCSCYVDGSCSMYGIWRPRECHDYRCALLEGYVDGTLDLDECLRTVQEVRRLKAEVLLAKATFQVVDRKYFHRPTPDAG